MLKLARRIVLFLACMVFVGLTVADRWIWCTDFVAEELGIGSYGNASTWWDDVRFTDTGYTKSSLPAIGSIIVFNSWASNSYGHVGIVRKIVSPTEIIIDHSNWHWDGKVLRGVGVKAVNGSWSQVKVKYNPGDTAYGVTSYPIRGFLILPLSTYPVIGINSPYFVSNCIVVSPADSRCDAFEIALWKRCWEAPFIQSPLCDFGVGGGDYVTPLPDLIMNQVWLVDDVGARRTSFAPGQHVQMKGQVKNTGNGNSSAAVSLKFYLSKGELVDGNKQQVGTDTIQASSLPSRGTHTETEGLYVPLIPGTYNVIACVDTGNDVIEENELNNCSREEVFVVDDSSWLIPILNLLLED